MYVEPILLTLQNYKQANGDTEKVRHLMHLHLSFLLVIDTLIPSVRQRFRQM